MPKAEPGEEFLGRVFRDGGSRVIALPPILDIPEQTPVKLTIMRKENGRVSEIAVRFGQVQFAQILLAFVASAFAGTWLGAWLTLL